MRHRHVLQSECGSPNETRRFLKWLENGHWPVSEVRREHCRELVRTGSDFTWQDVADAGYMEGGDELFTLEDHEPASWRERWELAMSGE